MYSKVWDEITHRFANFNGANWSFVMDEYNIVPQFVMDEILIHAAIKVNPSLQRVPL